MERNADLTPFEELQANLASQDGLVNYYNEVNTLAPGVKFYEIEDVEERAGAFNLQGIIMMNSGKYAVAADLMLEAKNMVGPGHPQYLVSISNMENSLMLSVERILAISTPKKLKTAIEPVKARSSWWAE